MAQLQPPLSILFAIFLLFPLASGCIGGDREDPDPTPTGDAGPTASEDLSPWSIDTSGVLHYTWGVALGFRTVAADGCSSGIVSVPPNSTSLTVTIETSLLVPDRPGAGHATFQMKPDGGDQWLRPDTTQPEPTVTLEQEDPSPTDWSIWAWPDPVLVNQEISVNISIMGSGPPPAPVSFETTGLGCPEEQASTGVDIPPLPDADPSVWGAGHFS